MSLQRPRPIHIAILLPSLAAGGVAPGKLRLARALHSAGHPVDLIVCKPEGAHREQVPEGVPVVVLQPESVLAARARLLRLDPSGARVLARPALLARRPAPVQPYVADLARYLDRRRPDIVLAGKTPTNLLALWARRLSDAKPRIVVCEHSQLSRAIAHSRKWRWRYIAPLVARAYAEADAIVCVSHGVADDLARTTGLPRARLTTIYNPVIPADLCARVAEPPPHPWLATAADVPVVVGAGRLVAQKNFPLLLEAFARLHAERPLRLLVLGEGRERPRLEAAAQALGVAAAVALPGHVMNPYAAFARASLFVLSSDLEGLPNVLIEALACGCPVVSTDCPSGPAEILQGGRYGKLVRPGSVPELAQAMAAALAEPLPAALLRQRGQSFSVAASAARYLELFEALVGERPRAELAG